MFAVCVGIASLAIWLYLLLARGAFWRLQREQWAPPKEPLPTRTVVVIVPARNEAEVVGEAVRSLVEQNYEGPFHVFLVDDASTDGTAQVARHAAAEAGRADRLTVVQAPSLPNGWTGKLWALSEGLRQAAKFGADYFLFSDADIVHEPNNLAHLVERVETGNFDLVSLMVRLSCNSFAEQALIPAFVFFFFMLYPPAWVENPDRSTAAAAGGCILIRAHALARIGGLAGIRGELIDDCALARAVKRDGRIWLGLATNTRSLRNYPTWTQIEPMISRTAFTQLGHSTWLLVGTVLAMTLSFFVPPLLLVTNAPAAYLGVATWLLMAYVFWPTLRYYKRSQLWAPLLPLIAAFYVGATVHSAIRYWQGRGGLWKGRIQDPAGARAQR